MIFLLDSKKDLTKSLEALLLCYRSNIIVLQNKNVQIQDYLVMETVIIVMGCVNVFSFSFFQKLRVRTVSGSGFQLSFGTIPGILCSKYMLVDGDKVMFGSYG